MVSYRMQNAEFMSFNEHFSFTFVILLFPVLPVKNTWESHLPCELFKISQQLLLNSCFVSRRRWDELETL